MTTKEAAALTALLVANYTTWKPEEATLRLYVKILEPLDVTLCERAVLERIRTPQPFAPVSGEIVTRVAELELARAGVQLLGASEAFSEVERQLSICGYRGEPVFDNPIIERTVNLIGWREIREATERGVLRAQWRAAYLEFCEAARREAVETIAAGRVLPGPAERQKLLADQTAADEQERKLREEIYWLEQKVRLGSISRETFLQFKASGLSAREFFSQRALPAPSEDAARA